MRDVTALEIEMVNGGNAQEWFDQARSMFQSWFGSPPPPNQPVQLSSQQVTQLTQACINAGGTPRYGSGGGNVDLTFMGVRVGSVSANGSAAQQTFTCYM